MKQSSQAVLFVTEAKLCLSRKYKGTIGTERSREHTSTNQHRDEQEPSVKNRAMASVSFSKTKRV